MSKVCWLHISDMHILKKTATPAAEEHNQSTVLDKFLGFLESDFPKQFSNPKFIAITGDLAFCGSEGDYKSSEYSVASFVKKMGESLFGANNYADKLFPVAGNHDVNRQYLGDNFTEIANLNRVKSVDGINQVFLGKDTNSKKCKNDVLGRFQDYLEFVRDLWDEPKLSLQDALWYNKYLPIDGRDEKINIIGLCSSWLCHSYWKAYMEGTGQEKETEITAHLSLCEGLVKQRIDLIDNSALTISLMHHDYEITTDRNTGTKNMLQGRCNFILCGHEHNETWAEPIGGVSHKLRAGCLYESRDHRNSFNIVEVDLDANNVQMMTVHYRKDKGGSWLVDRDADPTDGKPKFGYCFDKNTGLLSFPLRSTENEVVGIGYHGNINKLCIYAIKTKELLKNLELRYVELDTTIRTYSLEEIPELFAFEWQDELEPDPYAFNSEDPRLPKDTPLNDSVVKIIGENKRLWLIGEPGAGKTTSLQKVAYVACNRLLGCPEKSPCPVFLVAAQLNNRNSLVNAIAMKIEVCKSEVEQLLEEGKLLLLIDGINEVPEDCQAQVLRQIKSLLDEYPNTGFVLSSRKHAFTNVFKIPIYELMPLTDDQILTYLKKNIGEKTRVIQIYNDLMSSNGKIIDLARNPLMLCMVAKVTTNEGLPSNQGVLFRQFSKWLLSRERMISQFSVETKEYVLASLAFLFRVRDTLYLDRTIVLGHIKDVFGQMNLSYDIFKFYDELLKNGMLSVDSSNRVQFSHELFLEYYSAEYLLDVYLKGEFDIKRYKQKSKWEQPIIILTGLLPESNDIIKGLFDKKNIVLAARCLASGAIVGRDTMKHFVSILERKLYIKSQKLKACSALLELGTEDSLRILVRHSLMIDRLFEWAIRDVERPEMAILKLLKFGQTGLKRIKSCMRVLCNSANLKYLRDTEDVAKAQIKILKSDPESTDLAMIAKMGISQRYLPEAEEIISEILQHEGLDTSKWRSCVALAISSSFEIDKIFERISNIEAASGELEFSIFITCIKNRTEKSLELAKKRIYKCLDEGLYLLAIKYIESFSLESSCPFEEVEKYIKESAYKGKIGAIAAWKNLFSEEEIQPHLKVAISVQLEKENLDVLVQYGDIVRGQLDEFSDIILKTLLSFSKGSPKRRRKYIGKILALIKNKEVFSSLGMITSCNIKKCYGFIAHLVTQKEYFFHFSSIEQKGIMPAIGQFVSFDDDKVIVKPEKLPKILRLKILS